MTKILTMRGYITVAALLLLSMAALAMTGCNTVEGMGRDLQDAGQAIEDTF